MSAVAPWAPPTWGIAQARIHARVTLIVETSGCRILRMITPDRRVAARRGGCSGEGAARSFGLFSPFLCSPPHTGARRGAAGLIGGRLVAQQDADGGCIAALGALAHRCLALQRTRVKDPFARARNDD